MFLCYPKKLLKLYQSVYPSDTETSIEKIVREMKIKGGGSSVRMKAAFKQELPIVMKTVTYNNAQSLVTSLAKKAKLERAPKIFRYIAHPRKEKIEVFNQVANYNESRDDAALCKIPAKAPFPPISVEAISFQYSPSNTEILETLTLAADVLEKSNGKDFYLKFAKELLQEAREKLGGVDNARS